jgi:adenosylhomocysteinase
MVKNRGRLKPKVYSVPEEIDKQVARLKLSSMGIDIDSLSPEQKEYLTSWEQGT